MGLFGFDKVSFVVGLGITLLLCGLIMFYVKQKFSVYDRAIMEQSQLLKHLVSSIQMNSSSLSANGAVDTARKVHNLFGEENNRIVVSDDESGDDDNDDNDDNVSSDSETISDSDDSDDDCDDSVDGDNECDNNIEGCVTESNSLEDEKLNIKVVNVDDLNILNINHLSEEQTTNLMFNKENDTYTENDNDEQDINENVDNAEKKWILENDNLEIMTEKSKYIELNKVQLQELCKERNLSIKGSKKDLIDRLIE